MLTHQILGHAGAGPEVTCEYASLLRYPAPEDVGGDSSWLSTQRDLRLVTAQENLIHPEILQLINEGNLIKLSPNWTKSPKFTRHY